jgi:hypothetical protein
VLAFHANAFFGKASHDFIETRNLQIGERLVGFIRLREMGHRAFQQERFLGANLFGERERLGPAHAIAAHAGIEFHVHRHAFALAGGHLGELADSVRFVDTYGQIMGNAPGQLGFLTFSQEEQGCRDSGITKRQRLLQRAQTQARSAFFEGDARDVQSPMAIGFILANRH